MTRSKNYTFLLYDLNNCVLLLLLAMKYITLVRVFSYNTKQQSLRSGCLIHSSTYLPLSLTLTITLTLLTLTVTVRVTLTQLILIPDTVVNKAPTSQRLPVKRGAECECGNSGEA